MTIRDEIITEVQKGRAGGNQGLSMGLPKLESIIDGVCRETYTLIISNSGSGKTSYALYAYLYKPLMATIDNDDFKVLYFSLEMNRMSLFVKLLSIYIFENFGKQLSFKKILSRERDFILSDDDYELVMKCMPWIEKISKKVEIYDKNVNANTIYAILKDRLSKMGTFTETETRLTYTPNNPNLIYNVIVDHVGLLNPVQGHTLKQEIDLFSKYMVFFREKCKISPIVIQQANREQGNIERLKQGRSSFSINDFKNQSISKFILPYIIDSMKYKIHKSLLNSVKQENSKLDNPVLNPREIEEKAKRLDVIPNEKDEDIKSSTKAGHCSE